MKQYLDLLQDILDNGDVKSDRTGTGTISVFGRMMRFDISDTFPLLTTKKVHFKSIAHELLWFLKGTDDISYLKEHGVRIWDEWEYNGSIGPMYGVQWLHFKDERGNEFNQIDALINEINNRPDSRRMVVSAWNPAYLPDPSLSPKENVKAGNGCLAPCHAFMQFIVNDNKLSCMLTQRSGDVFLGVPFNIASYALLTMMIAQQTGLKTGEFIWSGGDVHIYHNLLDQVKLQLSRTPKTLPKLVFSRKPDSIYDYQYEDFILEGYDPHPLIKGKVSV